MYRENMKNIWEEYSFLVHYVYYAMPEEYVLKSLVVNSESKKTKKDAGGMQNRFKQGGNTKNHFIDAVGAFENYIASLTKYVYLDYPGKIESGGMDEKKLFKLIISSEDKQKMLDIIIEEKIRSIFYGNPIDIFKKDKCHLELGNIFCEQYQDAINLYQEIVGRRNVIIHNNGKIDKKYLRENNGSKLMEGQKIIISEDYLRGTIGLLMGIAAVTTKCVVENIYSGDCEGKMAKAVLAFDRCIKNGWYEELLSKDAKK